MTSSSLDPQALAGYEFRELSELRTPALIIYPDIVRDNVTTTIRLLGDADRWRVHVKTIKLAAIMRQIVSQGVRHLKCATTLELSTACASTAPDVLLAHHVVGPTVSRVLEIADGHQNVKVSTLIEDSARIGPWRGGRVGLFVDVNPGMDRTGISHDAVGDIVALARDVLNAGLEFRGLHYYDGHLAALKAGEAERVAHAGYSRLIRILEALDAAGVRPGEVVTAGTPAFLWSLSFDGFRSSRWIHRVSPGTLVYNDTTSLRQLPDALGYRPAVLVATRVVSRPRADRVTCDAGHKTVSADAGVPTCAVLGRPELTPLAPSEEHLPIAVPAGGACPRVGDVLLLVPRHVCPSVNNFDLAVFARHGRVTAIEPVTARGRESPLGRPAIVNEA
jgi:D-serine deaminase-like pyridoxal phosphate-dependent protein